MYGGKLEVVVLEVAGLSPALHGMRNAFNSHHLSDTRFNNRGEIIIGTADMTLAKKLVIGGSEHRKFLRQIQVWIDITTTRYHWQELDTYKFGTKNSESTIHTLYKRPFVLEDFYFGDDPIILTTKHFENHVIPTLNWLRDLYLRDKDYRWIIEMKRMLPENFLQRRTLNTNYEELFNIHSQRKNHRLKEEWGILLDTIEKLPYFKEMVLQVYHKEG